MVVKELKRLTLINFLLFPAGACLLFLVVWVFLAYEEYESARRPLQTDMAWADGIGAGIIAGCFAGFSAAFLLVAHHVKVIHDIFMKRLRGRYLLYNVLALLVPYAVFSLLLGLAYINKHF